MMLLTDKEIEQLKAFYNVQTDRELIEAMDSHLPDCWLIALHSPQFGLQFSQV
jgi:hypothetical protein